MPYSITTNDGITIDNIPDSIAPDAPELKARVQSLRAGGSALPAKQPETTLSGVAGAITRGAGPIAAGAALGALAGTPIGGVGAVPGAVAGAGAAGIATLVGDPIVSTVNSLLGTKYQMPSQALEDLFTRLGVAQPKTEAERIIQTTAAGAAGAGGIAAAGQALQAAASPVTRAVGAQLAAQPLQQMAGGAGAGAAGQLAQEEGAGPLGQLAASLAGGVAGAKLAAPRSIAKASASAVQPIKEAEQAGISVMTSDVVPPKTFASKWLRSTGEKIPVAGTGEARKVQQAQRVQAVRNFVDDYSIEGAGGLPEKVMTDLASKRSSDISKYSGLKNEVIDRLNGAGAVPVPKVTQEIDKQISSLQSMKTEAVVPVIHRLEDFKSSVQNQGLRNIEELRKQLGESFKAPELTSVRNVSEKSTGKIYGALRQDMADFISANGERRDLTKWEVANKRLTEMAGELKGTALKSVLNRGEATPEVVNSLLFSAKPSEVQSLYKGLTPQGRSYARMAVIAKAAEKAGGVESISPDKFANEVKRLSAPINGLFDKESQQRLQGLVRAIDLTKQAARAADSPSTGVQLSIPVGAAVLTDLLGGAGAATATGATLGTAARIYESAPVRNLLLKLPKVTRGSPEEAALVKRLISAVQAQQSNSQQSEDK